MTYFIDIFINIKKLELIKNSSSKIQYGALREDVQQLLGQKK